jgi:hypothetical protein
MDKQTLVHLYNGISSNWQKEINYHATKRHEGTINAYCYMKEISLKMLTL